MYRYICNIYIYTMMYAIKKCMTKNNEQWDKYTHTCVCIIYIYANNIIYIISYIMLYYIIWYYTILYYIIWYYTILNNITYIMYIKCIYIYTCVCVCSKFTKLHAPWEVPSHRIMIYKDPYLLRISKGNELKANLWLPHQMIVPE